MFFSSIEDLIPDAQHICVDFAGLFVGGHIIEMDAYESLSSRSNVAKMVVECCCIHAHWIASQHKLRFAIDPEEFAAGQQLKPWTLAPVALGLGFRDARRKRSCCQDNKCEEASLNICFHGRKDVKTR